MKILNVFLLLICFNLSFAQDITITNIMNANLNQGDWSTWTRSNQSLRIEFSGQPGVFTLSLSGCSMEMVKFAGKDEDGNHYYEAVSAMMGGTWCNKSYDSVVLSKSLDEFIKDQDAILHIYYDQQNATAYKKE